MTDYSIRRGSPEDGAGLCRVHRRSILALGRAAYSAAEVESWAAGLVAKGYGRAMTEGGEVFSIALDGAGDIVEFCSTREDEVVALYVDPAWTRRGLGRDLLRRAESEIAAAGYVGIRIGASLNGRPFYEAEGYRVVGRRDWRTRGGLVIEILEMAKAIS